MGNQGTDVLIAETHRKETLILTNPTDSLREEIRCSNFFRSAGHDRLPEDMEMLGIVASLVMVKELAWKFSVPSGDSDLYDPRDTCCNCVPQQPP